MTIAVRKLQPMATAQTKALLHSVKSPSFEMSCFTLTDYAQKRRARDSNPQPVSRHHISSVAASHSLTLPYTNQSQFRADRFGRQEGMPRRALAGGAYGVFG